MSVQGYYRFPTIHGDTVVFTAEDDLWRVSVAGGRAERLTAGVAEASYPYFSPDGRQIAFTSTEEGAPEVFVMPSDGGPANRLTFAGVRSLVRGWKPDGSAILFVSSTQQPSVRFRSIFAVSPGGGLPEKVYDIAHSIAFGPRGGVVLGRNTAEPAFWKRYRGGTAGYLWVDASGSGEFRRLLNLQGNMTNPCWVGERIYFISDHEGIGNVYSCLPDGAELRRHTQQTEYYARGLSSDGHGLVYFAGGDLYLLAPDATASTRIPVELASSRAQRARKFVPAGKFLDSWAPHPEGYAVALTTRGEAFSMGNWEGPVIQHGKPEGVRYRLLTWLADGKRLVGIADDGTEPRLVVFAADGATPDRVYDTLDIGHVVELRASPVGEQIVLVNHRNEVVLVDLAAGALRVVDRSAYGRSETAAIESLREMRGLAWSPDGRWLAYALRLNPRQTAIKVCRVETGATYQVTEPVLHDMQPAFDPNGKYLYFVSARTFDPVQDSLQFEWGFPNGIRPYLVTLRKDVRSPFLPVPETPKSEAARQLEAAASEEKKAGPPAVEIEFDGIASRIVAFPVGEGRYGRVQGTHDGVVFTSYPIAGTRSEPIWSRLQAPQGALDAYSFESHKQDRIADGVSDFEVTANGKTLMYRSGERLRVLKAGEKPHAEGEAANKPGRESGWLDLERVKVAVRPAAEWRQMFGEAWRLQREQFWVADMAGVDWQRAYERYARLLDRIGSRGELSDLMWELQGELGSSHAYEMGGEYRTHPEYAQGHLGVDWRYDPATGRYLIERLVRGDPWDTAATSPLLAAGVNVGVGDALVAINGQRLSGERTPQQALVNLAGQEVELVIQPAAGGAERTVTVRALASEHPARYRDWVEGNRRAVHAATGGRVGYVHIPDMAYDGFAEFHRSYLTEYDREGLIVDVRWNGGGMVSGLILEKLARPRIGYAFPRRGDPEPYVQESPRGPLVALTDENAGSDGDIFSHGFKMLKLGPLIGQRTWGGVIGIEPYMPLVDGTTTTQPEFSFWFRDVGWGVENYGTDPTIAVEYPPQAYAAGEDPQLARGIVEALRLIEEHPSQTPRPGQPPRRGV